MTDYQALFTPMERASFALRALYTSRGFSPYRMSKFEEYDLYAKNKDFLVSPQIITFTDTDGKLMALKPDVTLSIAKNFDPAQKLQKVYYNENVYRPASEGGYREIVQSGIECMGEIGPQEEEAVLALAAESLAAVSRRFVLAVNDLGLLDGLFEAMDASGALADELLECVRSKNAAQAARLLEQTDVSGQVADALVQCISASGPLGEVGRQLSGCVQNDTMAAALSRLQALSESPALSGFGEEIVFDFSVLPNRRFYGGLVFGGYVASSPSAVLSGGRYDKLMHRLSKRGGAIGFAVYLDRLFFPGTKEEM